MKNTFLDVEQKIIHDECVFHYVKSTGPGGQNINKRNTKVQLFFNFEESKYLTQEEKDELKKSFPEGNITISNQQERSQNQNKEHAIKKLIEILLTKSIPPKERIETQLPPSQKEKRYVDKTRQWQKKKIRSKKINLDNEE